MPATTVVVMMVMMSANVASLRIHPEGSLDVFVPGEYIFFQKNTATTSKLQAPEG
jgi:hypothetical protein